MTTYTIEQVETAINYSRQCHASGEDAALCANARVLADIYGLMIYSHALSVFAETFTVEQTHAMTVGLDPIPQTLEHQ